MQAHTILPSDVQRTSGKNDQAPLQGMCHSPSTLYSNIRMDSDLRQNLWARRTPLESWSHQTQTDWEGRHKLTMPKTRSGELRLGPANLPVELTIHSPHGLQVLLNLRENLFLLAIPCSRSIERQYWMTKYKERAPHGVKMLWEIHNYSGYISRPHRVPTWGNL